MPPSSNRDPLRRRAFLGVGLREERGALVVTRVVDDSMAARAGVGVGDALVALDGRAVGSVRSVRASVRALDETTRLTIRRGAHTHDLETRTRPFPVEVVPGAAVELGEVTVDGTRLRTIATVPNAATIQDSAPVPERAHEERTHSERAHGPEGARAPERARGPERALGPERAPGLRPAVLFLDGVRCESIEHPFDPAAPVARIVRGLSDTGFVTLRVERSGIGDSEGPPCPAVGFHDEHAAYRAALDALRAHPSVDAQAVFVYGHSVGGMHAALLSAESHTRGAIVYGSCAQRWSRCLRDGMARQLGLRGLAPDAIAAELRRFDEEFPDARYDRAAAFHRELDAVDLAATWRAVDVPVAVLAGEHDWVVGLDAQRALAALCPRAELVVLDGLDHAFGRHASLEDSLRDYGRGAFDPRLVDVPVRFARGVLQAADYGAKF